MTLDNWEAHINNPLIVKVFSKIKWVEGLGYGRKNIKKYAPFYFEDYQIGIEHKGKIVFSITFKSFSPQDTLQVNQLRAALLGEMTREE